ncbi:MAG: hypothetical protein PHI97_10585 [Desulfobulbus sp.]|nr:hypothetical protein [Desulfobulbus sp.]
MSNAVEDSGSPLYADNISRLFSSVMLKYPFEERGEKPIAKHRKFQPMLEQHPHSWFILLFYFKHYPEGGFEDIYA